jgi:hypothetical protein
MSKNKQQEAREKAKERFKTMWINAFSRPTEIIYPKKQNAVEKPLDEKLFNLANEFAVAGYGDVAVKLHSIHNSFLNNKKHIRR